MQREVTERFRLTRKEERTLRRLSKAEGVTKSELLRKGLRLVERVRRRRQNIGLLIESAKLKGDDEPRIRLRP